MIKYNKTLKLQYLNQIRIIKIQTVKSTKLHIKSVIK